MPQSGMICEADQFNIINYSICFIDIFSIHNYAQYYL